VPGYQSSGYFGLGAPAMIPAEPNPLLERYVTFRRLRTWVGQASFIALMSPLLSGNFKADRRVI
jgi:hypothetical protein